MCVEQSRACAAETYSRRPVMMNDCRSGSGSVTAFHFISLSLFLLSAGRRRSSNSVRIYHNTLKCQHHDIIFDRYHPPTEPRGAPAHSLISKDRRADPLSAVFYLFLSRSLIFSLSFPLPLHMYFSFLSSSSSSLVLT